MWMMLGVATYRHCLMAYVSAQANILSLFVAVIIVLVSVRSSFSIEYFDLN